MFGKMNFDSFASKSDARKAAVRAGLREHNLKFEEEGGRIKVPYVSKVPGKSSFEVFVELPEGEAKQGELTWANVYSAIAVKPVDRALLMEAIGFANSVSDPCGRYLLDLDERIVRIECLPFFEGEDWKQISFDTVVRVSLWSDTEMEELLRVADGRTEDFDTFRERFLVS